MSGLAIFVAAAAAISLAQANKQLLLPSTASADNENENLDAATNLTENGPIFVSSIRRNDSEYSLGLGGSESVDRDLNTLGELCSAGQVGLQLGKAAAALAVGWVLCSVAYDRVQRRT